ncbi:fumarylacetoacetate hydrolase family protein [Microbacterium murale]|uniref:2-keto-4-pentenoate hydratase/2-oxohepta-3-ene-1,7-dioic acid hydratase in catechol pathway n=1 Tax=Microbacterium murale TaxID=1081040 RepID=A0ABU0P644_9MICO|nr:fumarylacetoacetate hydrolase family protein [Microbacterium murale]MDQ0642794.1 2-keto-4-pentenoate hydratase/2-oxohepta-3-ene-1,7-dioic acid hydratase in catechol pathway [Microbacterium murale]
MRIARWTHNGHVGEGFVIDDRVIGFADGESVTEILARGLEGAREAQERVLHQLRESEAPALLLADVALLAPLVPASIRDFVAFEEHVEGVSAGVEGKSHVAPEWYEAPTFYFTNPHTVHAPGQELRPPVTERLDFELELAAIIGAAPAVGESNLTATDAASVIFGYTIMNDWSARDLQAREMQVRLGPAKGKDFGTVLGPWIVTADEFEQYLDEEGFLQLRAEVRVNGELLGEDLISNMGWPFPELVAYASRNSRVISGDVLGSGTVGNGGCLGELWGRNQGLVPPPLKEGDVVAMSIEGIGDLVNRVGAPQAAPELPPARRRTRQRHRTHRGTA